MAGKIKNAVAKKEQNAVGKPKTMQQYIKRMEGEIAKALPSVMTPERFTRMVLTAISKTPALADTTPETFLGAMMTAAQLGLEPNNEATGQAYLIPFNNRKKGIKECKFVLGYRGMIDLAYRSNVKEIHAHEVCENDEFSFEYGLNPNLKHVPALKDRGNVIAYYAVFKTENGGSGFQVMSPEDIKTLMKKNPQFAGFDNGAWKDYFDAMAKKTVLKQTLKYAPLRTDFVRAISADDSVREINENASREEMDFETANMVTAEYDVVEDEQMDPYDMADGDLAEGEIPLDAFKDAAGDEPEFMKE